MASVYLRFIPPPNTHDLDKLHVWEAPAADATFQKVQTFEEVGAYPDWIDFVEVTNAVSALDFFAIQWESSAGVLSELSSPVQGTKETLVGEIVDRVLIRSPLLDDNVVQQESEAVIEMVLPGIDPYTVDRSQVTYRQKSGITFLVLARSLLTTVLVSSGNTQSYTAGLVSQTLGSSSQQQQSLKNIEQMIEWANRDLGLNTSLILEMRRCVIECNGNYYWPQVWDITFEALTP